MFQLRQKHVFRARRPTGAHVLGTKEARKIKTHIRGPRRNVGPIRADGDEAIPLET